MAVMLEAPFPFWSVFRRLDNGLALGEALAFPEVSRLATRRRALADALGGNVRRLVEKAPLSGLHRRHVGGEPAVGAVTVPLDPTGAGAGWRRPLPLSFAILTWEHGGAAVAFVPDLGIEVVADWRRDLD